jgi:two-component system, chemotaxis family, chemotaxis protein CheY
MKTLIVEDDFTSRILMQELLNSYGPSHIAINGSEAIEAVRVALDGGEPYSLICLDIKMPIMDGQEALKEIRILEETRGINSSNKVKIVMTTAYADKINVIEAREHQCDYFLVKPIQKAKLIEVLHKLQLIS